MPASLAPPGPRLRDALRLPAVTKAIRDLETRRRALKAEYLALLRLRDLARAGDAGALAELRAQGLLEEPRAPDAAPVVTPAGPPPGE